MEKEEKIAEQKRRAEEMSFYGMLRRMYPFVALNVAQCLRLFCWFALGLKMRGCAAIFASQCLTIHSLPVTLALVWVTQVIASTLIEQGNLHVSQEVLVFNAIFCALLGGLAIALDKFVKKKKEDKDPVFQSIAAGSVIYVVLSTLYGYEESASF